jgi:hypothetical protein
VTAKLPIVASAALLLASSLTVCEAAAGEKDALDKPDYALTAPCAHEKAGTLRTKVFGSCYVIDQSTTKVAEIVDQSRVASACPVTVTWSPPYEPQPEPPRRCQEVKYSHQGRDLKFIQAGDAFRVNHWPDANVQDGRFQLVYRHATGVTRTVDLDPDTAPDGALLGFWGKDDEYEYRVFLAYSKASTFLPRMRKYWHIEVFKLGDTCIAYHKAAMAVKQDCSKDEPYDPEEAGQGSEGGGSEPPPGPK